LKKCTNQIRNEKYHKKEEKQAMIDRQLTGRQNLQDQVNPILRKHQKLLIQLKKDVTRYMEMDNLNQAFLQKRLNQMGQEKPRRLVGGRNYDHRQEI